MRYDGKSGEFGLREPRTQASSVKLDLTAHPARNRGIRRCYHFVSASIQISGLWTKPRYREDAMFLRARTRTKSVVTDIEDVIGRSSLLLATLFNPPVDANDMSDTGMNTDEREPEIRCVYCSLTSIYPHSQESIACNHSTSSEVSVDGVGIPLDAHILPGCGKRLNCLLPVVCVAPEHEIEALLTTVVCQRYVLNISLPVVGVSLPASGTTAKIILGWAEGKEDDRSDVVQSFLVR